MTAPPMSTPVTCATISVGLPAPINLPMDDTSGACCGGGVNPENADEVTLPYEYGTGTPIVLCSILTNFVSPVNALVRGVWGLNGKDEEEEDEDEEDEDEEDEDEDE